jgi:hypothetical protein
MRDVLSRGLRVQYLMMSVVLCANLAIGSSKPSYTEHSHGCSQEVQQAKER